MSQLSLSIDGELAKLVLHNPPSRVTNHGARRRQPPSCS
jgi:hypothetical protein